MSLSSCLKGPEVSWAISGDGDVAASCQGNRQRTISGAGGLGIPGKKQLPLSATAQFTRCSPGCFPDNTEEDEELCALLVGRGCSTAQVLVLVWGALVSCPRALGYSRFCPSTVAHARKVPLN